MSNWYWIDDARLSEFQSTRKNYVLEIAFTQDEYSQLVKTVTKTTKKAVTEFAKEAILDKLTSNKSDNNKDEWRLYTE